MINTVAQLLDELKNAEAAILKKEGIKHGPTIGDMYEGLTRDILDRSIPPSLGLRVVSGFIEGVNGEKSNQVDAMVVSGEGRAISYTDKFIWDIKNVLAVFEVKKTLYGAELEDAFQKMWRVSALALNCENQGGYNGKDITFGHKNFAKLTGYYPTMQDVECLPEPLPTMHYSTIFEQLAPVRVILGYEGYVNEKSLRDGIGYFLEKPSNHGQGRGFLSLPSLIICRNNSVVKLNGLPYYCAIDDLTGWWEIMASNSENPTRLLLEMIWTKISAETGVMLPMDDTLEKEKFFPFLRQKQIQKEIDGVMRKGFFMEFIDKAPPEPSKPDKQNWTPQDTNTIETVTLLQAAHRGFIRSDDASFTKFATEEQTTPADILEAMVKKRVLGWMDTEHSKARPIESTVMTVFTPSGDVVVSDQTDLLNLWTLDKIKEND